MLRGAVRVAPRTTVALVAAGILGCGGGDAPPRADLAIRGVTVLQPVDGSRTERRTVLVAGDRIVGVLPRADGDAAGASRVIDAGGLFLIPGLWDLHTHLTSADPNAAPLMVTQGVTGARDLGGLLATIDSMRSLILTGQIPGPRITRAGPTLNGAQNAPFHRVIDSPEAAREAVADLKAKGVDLLKTHNATGRETYFALLQAAAEAGLEVAGHVPTSVSPLEACEAGQASIEHIATIFEGTYLARFDSELAAFQGMDAWLQSDAPALVECFARKGTMFVPTLYAYEYRAHRAALYDDPPEGWKYLTAAHRSAFREASVPGETDRDPRVIAVRESLVGVGEILTRRLYEAGAPIGAGTDFAAAGIPGFGLHREIELLVEAGLPEPAAIWASARGPGERAGADPLTGRIETGAPADLVLLRADPFESIEALGAIEAVVLRGRLLDRAELDRVLEVLASR